MATVKVTASLGTKMKFFSEYENISPHASITIEREVDPGMTTAEMIEKFAADDAEIVQYADQLYDKARKVVEKKIEADIKSAKGGKAKTLG